MNKIKDWLSSVSVAAKLGMAATFFLAGYMALHDTYAIGPDIPEWMYPVLMAFGVALPTRKK